MLRTVTQAARSFHGRRGAAAPTAHDAPSVVTPNLQVCKHALHLPGKLGTASQLEFRDHAALSVSRRRALIQKPLGQLVAVVERERILRYKACQLGG